MSWGGGWWKPKSGVRKLRQSCPTSTSSFSVYSLENLSHDDAQNSAGHGEDTELGRHKEFTVSSQRETGL